MQGEVEIIYQILGSDRQRMGLGSTTCSDFLRRNRHSNRVSASCGLRFRETGFRSQRKMRRNHLPTVTMPSLRTNRRTDPANSGLFVLFQEISGSIRLRGGPGSSDTGQSGQWLACQTAPKGPFERKRVSQQVSKMERYVCHGALSPILFKGMPL